MNSAVRAVNFWSNNYIEYESNSDFWGAPSFEEYLNKIKSYLKDINNDLKKSGMWNIQLTRAIYFMYSKNNNEESVMHLKSDNTDIMINDKAD